MKTSKYFLYIKILSICGILLSVFLLWEQIFRPSFQPCSINSTINCDAIISGEVSKTFGIPTPIFGLVGYIVILASSILYKKKLLLGMSSFGLLFCLWIGFIEIFQLHVLCPVCIGCQLIMIAVFGLGLKVNFSQQE